MQRRNLEVLKNFFDQNKDKAIPFNWLQGRNFSEAFVICLGAGPWKFNRRKYIQNLALDKLQNKDISELTDTNFYPLKWQNQFLYNASLVNNFDTFCQEIKQKPNALQILRNLVKTNEAKVISLFCRDSLLSPCFPIDRHVKRKLQELLLPLKEDSMIDLCNQAGLNPNLCAVLFVRTASNMDNPDWSVK